MVHRPLLKEDQWHDLINVPTDEENLILHYSINGEDIERIRSKRGEENQLGFAIQICLMRFPGRALQVGEQLPIERNSSCNPVSLEAGQGSFRLCQIF